MSLTSGENFFISAGEYSGDLLGADLVVALRDHFPKLAPFGIGGPAMTSCGVQTVATIDQLGMMGIIEVAARLADLRMIETTVLQRIEIMKPQFAVLIDFAGFHLRLAEQLKARGVRVFQYVAPKLWAWGGKRAAALRRDFVGVLGVLPFEEDFFRRNDVPYTYVGSPHKDRAGKVRYRRDLLGFPATAQLIGCLPGSRMDEVRRMAPWIRAVAQVVRESMPEARFVVPVAPSLDFARVVAEFGGEAEASDGSRRVECGAFTFVSGMSLEVMSAADAAIVASGTATLECGLLGTPMVVIYEMNEISYALAQRLVKLQWVSLVNLIAGREVVREYIQTIPVADVARELLDLVRPTPRRAAMCADLENLRGGLVGGAAGNAASAIARIAEKSGLSLATFTDSTRGHAPPSTGR